MAALIFSKTAKKQLSELPKPEQKKVIHRIEVLLDDPLVGKPLKGQLDEIRTLRAWPYRVLYTFQNKTVVIRQIAHRQGVYK